MSLLGPYLRRKRLSLILPHLRGAVLDIGCGPEPLYAACRATVKRYVGIERSRELVDDLGRQYPEARFVDRDIDHDLLDLRESFDCVVMAALIEHVFNQEFFMRQVVRHLAPRGVVLITTPTVIGNDVVHRLGVAAGLFARSAMEDHIVIYNRRRFQTLAREVGLALDHYQLFQLACNQFAILRHAASEPTEHQG